MLVPNFQLLPLLSWPTVAKTAPRGTLLPQEPTVDNSWGHKDVPTDVLTSSLWLSHRKSPTTRWTTRVSFPQNSRGYVTKFAPHKALKLITYSKLTFDGRVRRPLCVQSRVVRGGMLQGAWRGSSSPTPSRKRARNEQLKCRHVD